MMTVREGYSVRLPHPLHLWQDLQQTDGVLRVGLVILAAPCSDTKRPHSHRLQHCLIQMFGD